MANIEPNAAIPQHLWAEDFLLRPITVQDAPADYAAVMETRDELRRWEQSSWPPEDFTVQANRDDLADLQHRHAAGRAWTYTVTDSAGGTCLGCVYVFRADATFLARSAVTALAGERWDRVQAVVYFWVRRSAREVRLDARLLDRLRDWFATTWQCPRTVFVTSSTYVEQLRLLEATDLVAQFELVEPGKAEKFVAFG